jgi:hypothetical protein
MTRGGDALGTSHWLAGTLNHLENAPSGPKVPALGSETYREALGASGLAWEPPKTTNHLPGILQAPPALCDPVFGVPAPWLSPVLTGIRGDILRLKKKCAQPPQKLPFDSLRRAESESQIGFEKLMSVLESGI